MIEDLQQRMRQVKSLQVNNKMCRTKAIPAHNNLYVIACLFIKLLWSKSHNKIISMT